MGKIAAISKKGRQYLKQHDIFIGFDKWIIKLWPSFLKVIIIKKQTISFLFLHEKFTWLIHILKWVHSIKESQELNKLKVTAKKRSWQKTLIFFLLKQCYVYRLIQTCQN